MQADELVQRPEGRQHERIIDCSRAGPYFLQPKRADYARILSQMRFIVPNKSGMEHWDVRDKNKRDKK